MTAQNLFGDLALDASVTAVRNALGPKATEATLAQVRDALGGKATDATVAGVTAALTGMQSPSGAMQVSGTREKFRDGFATGTVSAPVDPAAWTLVNETPDAGDGLGHLVLPGGDSQGASYLRVSLSPFVVGTGVHLISKAGYAMPIRHAWGVTMSQRNLGQEVLFGLAEADDTDATYGTKRTAQPADLPIVGSISITTNVATVTVTNHGLKGSDRVVLFGNTVRALNVGPVYVTVVDANTITVPITLGNASYAAGGYVRFADPAANLRNAAIQAWGDSTGAGTTTYAARRNGIRTRLLANQGAAASSPTQVNTSPYSDAFLAAGPMEIWANLDEVVWRSWNDGTGSMSGYTKFQQSIPDEDLKYRLYFRAKNLDNLTKPIARIVSIVKTGTSTATVTTDVAHGLIVGDPISITGVRDQTNFANVNGAVVATVPSTTTFTTSFGLAATATDTFGGMVWNSQGGISAPGGLGQVIQNITVANGIMSLTGNTAWSGVSPGDYVNVYGMASLHSAREGAFKVLRVLSNILELAAPNLTTQATNNTGGTVIKRTDARLHFCRILGHTRLMTEVVGGRGSVNDANNSVPVSIASSTTLNATQGSAPPVMTELTESATPLTANGLYSGATRDMGTDLTRQATRIKVAIRHVAGTNFGSLYLEQSLDNVNFYESWRCPIPSDGNLHTFEVPVHARYYRWRFQNGATAQTGFILQTRRTLLEGIAAEETDKNLSIPLTPAAGVAISANTTVNSPAIDLGTNHRWREAQLFVRADVASQTFGIEVSTDNTNWLLLPGATFLSGSTAGQVFLAATPIPTRYLRVRMVAGANASTGSIVNLNLLT